MSVRPSVHPSARVSVTRRYFVETAKHIIKPLSPAGTHTILVFPYQTLYSDRDPLTAEASNAGGYEKMAIFDQYLAFLESDTR